MTAARDHLLATTEELTCSLRAELPGHEWEWTERARAALICVEQSLRQHIVDTEAPAGLFSTEVDLTRPSLVRQVSKLRREHEQFLEQATGLQRQLETAAEVFRPPQRATPPSGALPQPASAGVFVNLGSVREALELLATALLHHRERETDLTQESVTTDLGAGD
jgi:hypothetical protein